MMIFSDRVPGQLLPPGAPWHCNAGRPLTPLQKVSEASGVSADLKAEAVKGLGEDVSAGASLIVTLGSVVVRGGLGYVAGRAMAPTSKQKNKYGWIGALSGGVFGLTGIAIQGAFALSKK